MPVRQAFQKLRAEGLLIIQQGKRPIIGAERVPWDFQRLRGFSEEMIRRGLTPSARVLSLDQKVPEADVATALNLMQTQSVYRLVRLRYIDQHPVALVTSFLPAHLFPGIERLDLAAQSLYHIVERIYGRLLQRADEVIGASRTRNRKKRRFSRLHQEAHSLSSKKLLTMSNRSLVEYSVSLLRGDRYTASVTSIRQA